MLTSACARRTPPRTVAAEQVAPVEEDAVEQILPAEQVAPAEEDIPPEQTLPAEQDVQAERSDPADQDFTAEQDVPAEQTDPAEQAVPVQNVTIIANPTIWDGVYTEEQRQRGESVYASSCVRCHGSDLVGDEVVEALVGEKFLKRWERKRVGSLFEFIRNEMPPKLKDRLTRPEYADVLAYILSMNQAPAGRKELADNFAALQDIRMARGD